MMLERYMGREMRARYLNPKWIDAMLKEGYTGARMIRQVTDNLWGWQVTVPEAVDGAKWQEMFETYVQDRHALGIREKFKAAENLASYKMMVDRMLMVVEKGYWKPAAETVAKLRETQADLAPAVAAEHASIARRAELQPAPGPALAPAANTPAAAMGKTTPIVKGRVLEEKARAASRSAATPAWSPQMLIIGFAGLALVAVGWWRGGQG
jgi:cobaltochelatase CobN